MTKKIMTSTDDFKLNKFKPHGRAEFERDGQILICHAVGPFNKELVVAIAAIQPKLLNEIISDGEWANITILSRSALATPDALLELGKYLSSIVNQSARSCASALVIGNYVEGRKFMAPYIIKAFADIGTKLVLFDTIRSANDWAVEEINTANKLRDAQRTGILG